MQEDLLGYLLGALDGPERDRLKHELSQNESLRTQLIELEEGLEPLEHVRWEFNPPAGLAASTCQLVSQFAAEHETTEFADDTADIRPASSQAGWGHTGERSTGSSSWNFIDFVVAAGISMAAAMMFFPAVANSRYNAQRNMCQNNLRYFGAALPLWAEHSSGKLPYIPTKGKTGVAGFYAPQLMDAGFVTDHDTFVCPSSRLGSIQSSFFVPDVDTIQRALGAKLVALQRRMGGSYCYNLGHFEGGRHRATQVRSRSHFAVMSDHVFLPGSNVQIRIHGQQGINVLFEDGHVKFIVQQPTRRQRTQQVKTTLTIGPIYSSAIVESWKRVCMQMTRCWHLAGFAPFRVKPIGHRLICRSRPRCNRSKAV